MIDWRSDFHLLARAVAPRRPAAGMANVLLTPVFAVSGTVAAWVKIARNMVGFVPWPGVIAGSAAREHEGEGGNNRMYGWRG